jgi:hypothetical protein
MASSVVVAWAAPGKTEVHDIVHIPNLSEHQSFHIIPVGD